MRALVGLGILGALVYVGYEFYKKAQTAKLATPAGLQQIVDASNLIPLSTRPFPSLTPTLVG